ncbi:hypothetical protein JCGZ_03657 [Jatropha curcas]|uniref:Uncharacterized protein n=1 Tax=Jatropha curcas TaxID=180498 RepID=A0A067JD19_JATCU|nr:hypothetical protein JCGZ_03657 [Jatropha curcas]
MASGLAGLFAVRENRLFEVQNLSIHRRYLVMSQHLLDEEVDSYVPPECAMLEGGMPAGGVVGILGSNAERASAVGQATAGPNQCDLVQQLVAALRQSAVAVPHAPVAPAPVSVHSSVERLR